MRSSSANRRATCCGSSASKPPTSTGSAICAAAPTSSCAKHPCDRSGRRAGPPQARPDPPGGSLAVLGKRGVVMKHIARKRFGQHFLTDGAIIDAIVDVIDPQPGEALIEIGP